MRSPSHSSHTAAYDTVTMPPTIPVRPSSVGDPVVVPPLLSASLGLLAAGLAIVGCLVDAMRTSNHIEAALVGVVGVLGAWMWTRYRHEQHALSDLLLYMVAATEQRDYHQPGHGQRVARYADVIARAAGLRGGARRRLRWAAALHDIGKINGGYGDLFAKSERLSPSEFAFVQTHANEGAVLIRPFPHLADLAPLIRAHHENWDGSGYPHGLFANEIPREARILRIADSIDTMLGGRPYHPKNTLDEVSVELERYAGTWYDPALVALVRSPVVWDTIRAMHGSDATRAGHRGPTPPSAALTTASAVAPIIEPRASTPAPPPAPFLTDVEVALPPERPTLRMHRSAP